MVSMMTDVIDKVFEDFKKQTGFKIGEIDLRAEQVAEGEMVLFAEVKNKDHHVFILFDPQTGAIANWGWVIPAGRAAWKMQEELIK